MTQALFFHPPSYSSSTARGVHILAFGGPIRTKNEQWCGGHLGDRSIRLAIIQRGVWLTTTVANSKGLANITFKMRGEECFQGVVVAGTFDRLHKGHTLLLTKALSLVAQGGRLVVGISSGPLLSEKPLSEIIEPFKIRVGMVEQYLRGLAQSKGQFIDIECLEIKEAVPELAVSDPQLDCIVVGQDTEVGTHAFNDSRVSKGLPPLKVVIVAVIHDEESEKCSSSSVCRQSLGTFGQRAKGDRLPRGPLVTGPYVVGLTGGIASGKSFVRALLKDKGAVVLDCDALSHLSYVPGTPTYHAMIAAFGHSIVSPVDGAINRQILGSIVFNDPNQMKILKNIVWASVGHLVAEKRERVAEQGGEIFVAEAALLLEAHWEKEMHEIWMVFAPLGVSRQRLMSRNQISEEEANKRIRSQMSSEECIALVDVVIFNGWTKDETEEQVAKAWDLLLHRVRRKSSREKVEDPLWFRWAGLMKRLHVNDEVALNWWPKLKNSYSEPWRHYYTLMHIRVLYAYYHEYAHFIAQPHVFQLAIFFHRIVHHPGGLTTDANELLSADSFQEFAREAGLGDVDRKCVNALILLSRHHGATVTEDLAFFLDFNLAVLGSSPEEYREYKAKVRQEFKDYDNELFETIFKNELQGYANQSQIFHTHPFQLKYLSAAQANICKEVSLENPNP